MIQSRLQFLCYLGEIFLNYLYLGQGKDNSRIFLRDNIKIANEIESKIRDIIAGESKSEPTSKNNGALEDVVDE